MKLNAAVAARVEKYRERRGFRIVDTNSKFFKFSKFLYGVVYSWFFLMCLGLILPIIFWPEMTTGIDTMHKTIVIASTVVSLAGCVSCYAKQYLLSFLLSLVSMVTAIFEYKYLMHYNLVTDFDDVVYDIFGVQILARYVWRHAAPAILVILIGCVILYVYARERHLFKRDYNKVLEAIYITYKDKLGSGTEEEWKALLDSLEDAALEAEFDKQYTREYEAKKAAAAEKEMRRAKKAKDVEEE